MSITTSSTRSRRLMKGALLLGLALSSTACAWSNKTKGAVIGTAGGAAAGAVVGSRTGSTARGAIIGAVVGGATGMIIGNQMDKQAEELMQQVPGATVQRVGEGLVVTFDSGLLYDFDSSEIRSEAGRNLRSLAASMEEYANTSAASIPIALAEMDEKGLLKAGNLVMLVGFGAGLTYGSAVIRW